MPSSHQWSPLAFPSLGVKATALSSPEPGDYLPSSRQPRAVWPFSSLTPLLSVPGTYQAQVHLTRYFFCLECSFRSSQGSRDPSPLYPDVTITGNPLPLLQTPNFSYAFSPCTYHHMTLYFHLCLLFSHREGGNCVCSFSVHPQRPEWCLAHRRYSLIHAD